MNLKIISAFLLVGSSVFAAEKIVLTPAGYGPVRFGARIDQVEKIVGDLAVRLGEDEGESCEFVRFAKLPGVTFMVEAGVLTRADLTDPSIENSAGIKVGTSLAVALRTWPNIRVNKNAYDSKAHDLVLKSADGKQALLFEESRGRITGIRAGLEPSVEYIEGCL